MFFYVSKLLWFVAEPTNALLFCLTAAVAVLAAGHRRTGLRIAAGVVVVLFLIAFLPVGTVLLRPLEDRFPAPAPDLAPPTGIVVLGGSTDESISAAREQVTVTGAATRITTAIALSRRFPTARLVFSGGSGAMLIRPRTEAEDTRDLWIALGVAPDRITIEDRSRNTFENALFTRQLLDPKPGERWLLVTSAWHMPRAVGIFREVGFPIIPVPVDYRTTGTGLDLLPSRSALQGLEQFDLAAKEWVGLLAYRLTGRTNALLPAPDGAR